MIVADPVMVVCGISMTNGMFDLDGGALCPLASVTIDDEVMVKEDPLSVSVNLRNADGVVVPASAASFTGGDESLSVDALVPSMVKMVGCGDPRLF